MNATKILWGQVLLVSAVVLAFVWGATEWVAWRLAFQPQLGRPWFELLGWPVYQPPAFFGSVSLGATGYIRHALFVVGLECDAVPGMWISDCRRTA
jgi:type IV secretory pathway TraG/TraD family ATPase VirD4